MHFSADHILDGICILECIFGNRILHLHFSCNAHILKDVLTFERSELYLHNAHLSTIVYTCLRRK